MLSSGMQCGLSGANVIIWDKMLSSEANVIMVSSDANVIMVSSGAIMISSGTKCYHLELMLSSGMNCYHLG